MGPGCVEGERHGGELELRRPFRCPPGRGEFSPRTSRKSVKSRQRRSASTVLAYCTRKASMHSVWGVVARGQCGPSNERPSLMQSENLHSQASCQPPFLTTYDSYGGRLGMAVLAEDLSAAGMGWTSRGTIASEPPTSMKHFCAVVPCVDTGPRSSPWSAPVA